MKERINQKGMRRARARATDGDLYYDFRNDQLPDGNLKLLHATWEASRDGDKLPSRAHFDPVTMPPQLLPWIAIFDVETDPTRFRVRLVGTGIVEAGGLDITGNYLDELPGAESVLARSTWALENRKAYYARDLPVTWAHEEYQHYSVVGLPLAIDGHDIDMLLYGLSFGF
ncbi:MAG: PAS domain-containing protein [Alphaproteobacteria bacterium]|nr:PAS domain-containing protein [Alphaproteobacteria bacterium]